MRKLTKLILASAAVCIGGIAMPAQAQQLIQCTTGSSCLNGTTNVVLTSATNVGTGYGNVGPSGPVVSFTSSQGNINLDASGQATITSAVATALNQLTFTLQPGYSFTGAEFNLLNGSANNLDVTLTTNTGATSTIALSNTNGSNWFDIIAASGQAFTSASFNSTGAGFADFRQLRLTLGPGAVPEPATWAMMLLGFGAIGVAMRRRRSNGQTLHIA